MLSAPELRKIVKSTMGPVFEKQGFKYKYEGKGSTWSKLVEGGTYEIGIGLFMDARNKLKPEFRFTLFVDPEDIRDIRAYSHSGWPPKKILKELDIKVSLIDRILGASYDAWIPFPKTDSLPQKTLEEYAHHLIHDLYGKIEKGKRVTKKTHRWEYE